MCVFVCWCVVLMSLSVVRVSLCVSVVVHESNMWFVCCVVVLCVCFFCVFFWSCSCCLLVLLGCPFNQLICVLFGVRLVFMLFCLMCCFLVFFLYGVCCSGCMCLLFVLISCFCSLWLPSRLLLLFACVEVLFV